MTDPAFYYTLPELVLQRENCLEFGLNTDGIDLEIALLVERQSMAERMQGIRDDRATMNKARDILDERATKFYDQDRDNGGPPDLSQTSDHYDWKE